jgi:hypothetical protein
MLKTLVVIRDKRGTIVNVTGLFSGGFSLFASKEKE